MIHINNSLDHHKIFNVHFSKSDNITSIIHPEDPYKMNWVGDAEWGKVLVEEDIDVSVTRTNSNSNRMKERYMFTNNTDFDIFVQKGDIGIYTPFPDQYDSSEICLTNRANAHIWCGGQSSYIMGLRMGGAAPHLGLMLTNGSIDTYSIDRDFNHSSNHRGNIILHPESFALLPGESYVIEWELFWHKGKTDFFEQLKTFSNYIHIESDKYVFFKGEDYKVTISPNLNNINNIEITCNDIPLPFTLHNSEIIIKGSYEVIGEYEYIVKVNNFKTYFRMLVVPPINELIEKRCEFIVEKQQFHRKNSMLDGAYLIYDNEENSVYYSHLHDHNGGRERIGMGVLLATFLQKHKSRILEKSLKKYIAYIERELFDKETGEVYNDINRNNDIFRLYNYSWFAVFYMELFNLYQNKEYLIYMSKILRAYYRNGGDQFYPIELPMYEMIQLLRENGLDAEAEIIYTSFQKHIDFIMRCGTAYPPSEVNYEQSIVAPAANCLIQMYKLTKDDTYLSAFQTHLSKLELFNGSQPDYHLHEVAIRHWDGYWFGKKKLYGDTFPHYWSSLTGRVYQEYAETTKKEPYRLLSEKSLRGTLSLFKPDGSASCARIFPFKINGISGNFEDPWANDQDWALYFMIRK